MSELTLLCLGWQEGQSVQAERRAWLTLNGWKTIKTNRWRHFEYSCLEYRSSTEHIEPSMTRLTFNSHEVTH